MSTPKETQKACTVYLAGDSTMQSYTPRQAPQGGWGQHIARYFAPDVSFFNHAIGGRSSRSFVEEGRLDVILRQMQAGDYLFVQMGHNDSTRQRPQRFTEPFTGFLRYLRMYVEGARACGGIPVLITPMARLHCENGVFLDDFPDYCAAVRRLAAEMDVPLIDLMKKSLDYYAGLWFEEAYSLFMVSANGTDHTHFTHKGADAIAWLVAGGVRALGLPISARAIAEDKPFGVADAPRPDTPDWKNFTFGVKRPTPGLIAVDTDTLYTPDTGCGFVTDAVRAKDESLQQPAVTNGFEPDAHLSVPCPPNGDVWEPGIGAEGNAVPLYFRVRVPEAGNYRVQITISDAPGAFTAVFSERRRFVYYGVPTPHTAGRETVSFVANVCDVIPRGKETIQDGTPKGKAPVCHDRAVDITVVGRHPVLYTVKVEKVRTVPTIFLAGDSTVTDQLAGTPYTPAGNYCGWGQSLPLYFNDGIAVSNHAHSGLTTETFRTHGHWDIARSLIRPGDFVFFQFGHNDQKEAALDAFGGYAENLRRYVREARELGAMPLLVTPVSRSRWNGPGGAFQDLLADNAAACKQVGIELSVWVLDLHARSVDFFKKLGPSRAQTYFHEGDQTHFNDRGGFEMAGLVAACIRETGAAGLAAYLKDAPEENPFPEGASGLPAGAAAAEADPHTLA